MPKWLILSNKENPKLQKRSLGNVEYKTHGYGKVSHIIEINVAHIDILSISQLQYPGIGYFQ